MNTPDLITLEEAAQILGLKTSTLRKWSYTGRLPVPKIKVSSHAVRLDRKAVIEWLNSQSEPPLEAA